MKHLARTCGLGALLLVLTAWAGAQAPAKEKIPIILDCDIGTDIDDTFALALAVASPEIDLRGVTTVSGDTRARAVMACRLLTAAGRQEVPVAAGKAEMPPQPLRGLQGQYARRPARGSQPVKESAVEFIYQKLKAEPGKITLVAVGPLRNIAQLLSEHPDCKPWIKRLVIMGGAVRVGYNNKPPIEAEFNIRADIKAAQEVFAAGIPLTVAPLDATTMLDMEDALLQRIFGAQTMLTYQVQALWQLWDQKAQPVLYDPVAVTLAFNESFCKMEELALQVDDQGFTREGKGKPNARVATSIRREDYLKWVAERLAGFGTKATPPRQSGNPSQLIPRTGMPNRVHVCEDYQTDIEKRWWLSGKPEMAGGSRACRGVLTHDFDGQQGDRAMYTAVIFNPVPGPPMGKNTRLSFRYWLKGSGTLRVQLYTLSKGYHRHLTLTGLPQEQWQSGTVDMTAARRPDGTGGPLAENERIDDIQFYTEPTAQLLIDDIVLYDAAVEGEKRPFPKRVIFTGWFDTGKQSQEWPGSFDVVADQGSFWKAAKSVNHPERDGPWIRLQLRGERPLGETTQLSFRYRLTGTDACQVALVNRTAKESQLVNLQGLTKDKWAETTVDFSTAKPRQPKLGDLVDEIHFLLPKGGELLLDDVLLYEPAAKP